MTMDKRYVDLKGTFNFRDVGGYETADHRIVKFGKLFRSDELSKITVEDVEQLRQLGIKTIIDYRNDKERKNNEDVLIPGSVVVHLDPIANIAALASGEFQTNEASGDSVTDEFGLGKMSAAYARHLMTEQNKAFVRSPRCKEVYREMFDLILKEENTAIVQHCRGGKDRTGYGIALILLALGVSKETVLEDYMLTNHYKKEKNELSLAKMLEETKNEDLVQAIRYFKEADASFLLAALDLIDQEYGGIQSYLLQELSIDNQKIELLKQMYLENKGE